MVRTKAPRIISGKWRNRTVTKLASGIRPTPDRAREALFSYLSARNRIAGSIWLDLYAGTGLIGLEALSRGASQTVFVDSSAKALANIEAFLDRLGAQADAQTHRLDLRRESLRIPHVGRPYDVIFMDPPYAEVPEFVRLKNTLTEQEVMHEDTLLIYEREKTSVLPESQGWDLLDQRAYGRVEFLMMQLA